MTYTALIILTTIFTKWLKSNFELSSHGDNVDQFIAGKLIFRNNFKHSSKKNETILKSNLSWRSEILPVNCKLIRECPQT